MTISNFVAYVKQVWKNKPDTSSPLSAERLNTIEGGIKGNSDAIEKIAAAVVSQIVNDPNKIASMAALYSVAADVSTLNGNLGGFRVKRDGWVSQFTLDIPALLPSGGMFLLLINHQSVSSVLVGQRVSSATIHDWIKKDAAVTISGTAGKQTFTATADMYYTLLLLN